jgi:hypothetical protein
MITHQNVRSTSPGMISRTNPMPIPIEAMIPATTTGVRCARAASNV